MSGGGGFFGFSTEMPELTPGELARLEQIHALEEDDKNEDTFGDIDELGMDGFGKALVHPYDRISRFPTIFLQRSIFRRIPMETTKRMRHVQVCM
jgi:hypothetical protein